MSAQRSHPVAPPRFREERSPLGQALERMVWHTGGVRASSRARVWERLAREERPERSRRVAGFCLSGAALASAILLALWSVERRRPIEPWRLEQLVGSVQIESGSDSQAARPGQLPAEARVRVGADGAAVLAGGEARLALAPGAVLQLGSQASLLEGAAAAQVPQGRRFRLAAGALVFEGSGAVFIAEASASRTSVRAASGSLRVLGAAGVTEVRPGESWSAGLGDAAQRPSDRAEEPGVSAALLTLLRAESFPTAAPIRPLAWQRPAAPMAPDAAAGILARAHEAEGEHLYSEAAGLYAQLSGMDDPRAEAALYELARLQLRFLHQPDAAVRSLDEERTRFPESPLAQEAALTAIDARLALGDDADTLRAMDSFLSRFAGSERAEEVRWSRARLQLRAGACVAAANDLAALASGSAFGGEALIAQAYCARRAGDESSAKARLRDYLRRYPNGSSRGEARAALGGAALGAP